MKNEIYNICGGFEQTNLETVDKILILYKGEDESLKESKSSTIEEEPEQEEDDGIN